MLSAQARHIIATKSPLIATNLHCPSLGRRTADPIYDDDADRLEDSPLRTWRIVVD